MPEASAIPVSPDTMKNITYLLAFIIAVFAFSCKASKQLSSAITKKDSSAIVLVDPHADSMNYIHGVVDSMQKKKIDFSTFSAKMKVDYWDKDGKGPDLTVFVRIQKDSIIWLSINVTVFSYEAFRVMITPDSVKLLNKKDKVIQLRSVEYLQDVAQLPLDFKTMQDLIIGNPVFVDRNIIPYKKEPELLSLLSVGGIFKNLLTIESKELLLQHSKLDDINAVRNRTCDLSYSAYDRLTGAPFSTMRRITIAEKGKLDVQMEFKQYSFNENLSYPFPVPKNYTVK
jgi:hypothetical protein